MWEAPVDECEQDAVPLILGCHKWLTQSKHSVNGKCIDALKSKWALR